MKYFLSFDNESVQKVESWQVKIAYSGQFGKWKSGQKKAAIFIKKSPLLGEPENLRLFI
ncbi:MAG: hypothetical protein R3C26_09480 [Calditrichia bacterium]